MTAADLDESVLSDRTTSPRSGLTHRYFRQRLSGVDVLGGDLALSVTADGRLIGLRNHFVPGLAGAVNTRAPVLTQTEAVEAAAAHLGLGISLPLTVEERQGGPMRAVVLSDGGISRDPIPVRLAYLADGDGGARLVWTLFLRLRDGSHWWNVSVDAVTGDVLSQVDWILNEGYLVFPPPLESPADGPQSLQTNPANATASPFGWHDTNGSAGAE